MKKLVFLSSILLMGMIASAQQAVSPHETSSTKDISVRYGRPYKKGRVIFGGLEKYGVVYRCGADSATTITFAKDGKLNGQAVKAGTYTLFVIPNETKWTIILNSVLGQ